MLSLATPFTRMFRLNFEVGKEGNEATAYSLR
jgi:hypothetical protein